MDLLLRRADIAMFHAKDSGRSTYAHFSAVMEGERLEDRSMAMALDSALANDEFEVFYQAIVAPGDQNTVALEALLRWNSPLHGEVPPSRFIPLLEYSNRIVAVGKWVLATACRNFKALQRPDLAGMALSVNLSARQFRDRNLLTDIGDVLRESGLDPSQLQFEISENALLEDAHAAGHTLAALKTLGVRIAIDNFGTGYSSLSHLRHFPLSMLKIDRSRVAELGTSADALWMVKTIITLAESLGIESTAEGVESAEQLALLSALGCSSVQGFWFHRPSPLQQLRTGWLAEKSAPGPAWRGVARGATWA
jgi:EAL domain-containing protein (putative c-di-GMP-specific phosphodiesterase class I)